MRYNFISSQTLKEDIYNHLSAKRRVRPSQLADRYFVSRTRVHQVLKELLNEGKIIKLGKMPKIDYRVVRN